jgi:hypothetical protein
VHGWEAEQYGGWSWSEPRGGEHFRRCSFCGSIHPDDLVAEPLWAPEWADMKYGFPHKFYIHIPNRDPDRLCVVSGRSRFDEAVDRPRGYVPVGELTDEQRSICERERWSIEPGHAVRFGTRPQHFGKFYTVHLADPAISDDVKEQVMAGSGLRLIFMDGRVTWARYEPA